MDNANQPSNGAINIGDLNNAIRETHIHIELSKTFYSITPSELTVLEAGASSILKDIALGCIGIGIPCCVNGIVEYNKNKKFDSEVFFNSVVGAVCIIIAVVFGILWWRSNNSCKNLIAEIKARPKYKMP